MIFDYKGKNLAEPTLPGANQTGVTVRLKIELHFGFKKDDDFDTSVVIPAPEVPELKLSVLWGDSSDLGSGVTIKSGQIKVTVYGVAYRPASYYLPAWQTYITKVTEVVSEFGRLYHEIMGYGKLSDIYIMELDANDNRVDGLVTEMRVYVPEFRHEPITIDDSTWKRETARTYNVDEDLLTGIRAVDPKKIWGVILDLDALKRERYSIRLEYKSSATGQVVHFYHAIQRPEEVMR